MSYSFYLFNRDAWDDPRGMLNKSDNLGKAKTGDQITLGNPESGQVVTVVVSRMWWKFSGGDLRALGF
ncbi:MAG: hypothetical protein O2873_13380, partial [Proteobacteria bacterium]|nr:hypothetical protein [Pseudomonadota bacterium]